MNVLKVFGDTQSSHQVWRNADVVCSTPILMTPIHNQKAGDNVFSVRGSAQSFSLVQDSNLEVVTSSRLRCSCYIPNHHFESWSRKHETPYLWNSSCRRQSQSNSRNHR